MGLFLDVDQCSVVKQEISGGEDWHVKRIRNSCLNSSNKQQTCSHYFSYVGCVFKSFWNTSFVGVAQISFHDPPCWKINGCIKNTIFNEHSWSLAALRSARRGSFLNSMKSSSTGELLTYCPLQLSDLIIEIWTRFCWSYGAFEISQYLISSQKGATSLFLHLWVSNGFFVCNVSHSHQLINGTARLYSCCARLYSCTLFYKWEAVRWEKKFLWKVPDRLIKGPF